MRWFRASQIVITTNFVVISCVGIQRVDCITFYENNTIYTILRSQQLPLRVGLKAVFYEYSL